MALEFGLNYTPEEIYDVVIIGAGPAGTTAAIYTARGGLKTVVLYRAEGDGALGVTQKIENYPGVPGPISGFELLTIMRDQAKSFGAEFVRGKVIATDFSEEVKKVFTIDGREFRGRSVIIASGAMERANKFKGEDEFLGRGVSYCGVCDAAFFKDQPVAVVGDDDYAIEEAEFISRFASDVYFLVPGSKIKAREEVIKEFEEIPNIHLLKRHRVIEIKGSQAVEAVRVKDGEAGEEKDIPVNGVFIFLGGTKPSVDFLMGQVEMTGDYCVVVNEEMMTSVPGVFAAGDVLCTSIKQAVIAAADGCKAALAVDKFLSGKKKITSQW